MNGNRLFLNMVTFVRNGDPYFRAIFIPKDGMVMKSEIVMNDHE